MPDSVTPPRPNTPPVNPSMDNQQIPVSSPEQVHQQMLKQVQDQLTAATGQTVEVEPVTADSTAEVTHAEDTPGDSLNQFYERVILNKPGFEPSKTFLGKLMDRMRKKYPNATIKFKENR